MFTGIIEEKARIKRISSTAPRQIDIVSRLEVAVGESVALQGICLTVSNVNDDGFAVEAMPQTLDLTTLSMWRPGGYVNIERSLRLGARIGGHIMLGHIDEAGTLIRKTGNKYLFKIDPKNARYLISKGSIGIDGISLTISGIAKNTFAVSLIPHTLKTTTLGMLRTGAKVNIEYDYLVKIVKS